MAQPNVIIGVMSGTSLDGLDLCACTFASDNTFEIIKAETISYDASTKALLREAETCSGVRLTGIDRTYGRLIGEHIARFMNQHLKDTVITAVASHGHTIFHNPTNGYTLQIGHGSAIAAACGLPVVCDFRSLDVALGGQGAPLVPIGDQLLFGNYDACLNIGGFANISFEENGIRVAGDICPANYILNELSSRLHMSYDAGGAIAQSGVVIPALLAQLNNLDFYKMKFPKSLGREWVEQEIRHLLPEILPTVDLLRTCTEHAAFQIAQSLNGRKNTIVTGGGAFNTFLVQRIREQTTCTVEIPDDQIVAFKEALIFAYLGWLRINNRINTLKSVTGGSKDSIGGAIYLA
ncbi:MAG: anhydro-N-acetylmuramic acid kinase [Bacteroidetes bacterium]|jgi:anhydro-N-acetylmuramic acid kinase|nr:anhydro-N-acetylmuramic acid kinase [Bacteroidota bacterium]